MKKIMLVLSVLLAVVFMAACSSDDTPETGPGVGVGVGVAEEDSGDVLTDDEIFALAFEMNLLSYSPAELEEMCWAVDVLGMSDFIWELRLGYGPEWESSYDAIASRLLSQYCR